MGRAREDVKCGALPNVFQGNRQEGRTDGRFVPASAWNPIFWRRYFILNKKRARPTFLLLFLVLPFNSAVETGLRSLFPLLSPNSERKSCPVERDLRWFLFSYNKRGVGLHFVCPTCPRRRRRRPRRRRERERERCVEKMKAGNPVRSNSIHATSAFQRFTKVANLRPSTTGRHTCQSLTRDTLSPA